MNYSYDPSEWVEFIEDGHVYDYNTVTKEKIWRGKKQLTSFRKEQESLTQDRKEVKKKEMQQLKRLRLELEETKKKEKANEEKKTSKEESEEPQEAQQEEEESQSPKEEESKADRQTRQSSGNGTARCTIGGRMPGMKGFGRTKVQQSGQSSQEPSRDQE